MSGFKITDSGNLLAWSVGSRTKTTGIVLHHAEANNCTVYDINRWHKNNGWAGIGYHYYVRKDGTIWTGRKIDQIGAHAGSNSSKPTFKYENWANKECIGICAEGRYTTETMPEIQREAIVWLCKYCIEKYPTITRIYKHKEISSTDCPGKNYPFDEIVAKVWKQEPEQLYRIRLAWDNEASQLGAYANLDNAKKVCPHGYHVYDSEGNEVYYSKFTAAEAREALRCAAGLEDYKGVYDLDGDGKITADEARQILREAAGLE